MCLVEMYYANWYKKYTFVHLRKRNPSVIVPPMFFQVFLSSSSAGFSICCHMQSSIYTGLPAPLQQLHVRTSRWFVKNVSGLSVYGINWIGLSLFNCALMWRHWNWQHILSLKAKTPKTERSSLIWELSNDAISFSAECKMWAIMFVF